MSARGGLLAPAVAVVAAVALSACVGPGDTRDGPPASAPPASQVAEPVPRAEPLSRYGNHSPYKVQGQRYHVMATASGYAERGVASWYGRKFHGRKTSSGEPYDMYRYTAAHRTLPLPTYVEVINLENGRSVIVRVNDRGPFRKNRLIDLSYMAAAKLDFVDQGTAPVEVRAVAAREPGGPDPAGGDIWLQVGAFSDRQRAGRVAARLRENGVTEVIIRGTRFSGRRLWRVRVGPFASEYRLREAERAIHQLGLGSANRVSAE